MLRLPVHLQRERDAIVARLDLLRSVGVRHMWRKRSARNRFTDLVGEHSWRVVAEMWREGADAVGAEMRLLSPKLFEFRQGTAVARISLHTTPFHDLVSMRVAEDKPLAYRILAEAGLPVPDHAVIDAADVDTARAFQQRFPPPFVVKPARGGGGAGVIGEIYTLGQLRRALVHVRRLGREALLERQIEGDSYRVLLLDGEVLDVLKRSRPRVTGDGRSTIEALISREHERRIAASSAAGLKPFMVDLDCLYSVQRAGYHLHSVLPAGVSIAVRTASNFNAREQIDTVDEAFLEGTIELARRATEVLGTRLAGVDFVRSDATRSRTEPGGIILEVEAIPGLTHHYRTDGTGALRVTVPILRALLEGRANAPARSGAAAAAS
jgi:cyanophycin synthetase